MHIRLLPEKFLLTDGLEITSQPKNCYLKESGNDVEFSIDAKDNKNDAKSISYQWQIYNSKSKTWTSVTNNKSNDPKKYVFEATESSINTPIRCVVTKMKESAESYVAISDIVTVLSIDEHTHTFDDNGFCSTCDGYETALLCLANSVDTVHILFFFYTLVQTLHGICTSILCGINYLFYLPLKSPFFFTIDLNILIVIRLVIFLYNFLCTPA